DTIARMKPLAKSKQVKIRFEVRTALVRVHGVKELLETALCNFIINSITALDLANVTSRLVIIRILTPNPAETAIQVLDNGIGIPGSIRERSSSLSLRRARTAAAWDLQSQATSFGCITGTYLVA